MDTSVYNNCVNFTYINDTVLWANNSTNLTIDVQAFMWPPFITYNEKVIQTGNSSVLHYEWCGPLIFTLIQIAKYMNAKYDI